MTSWTRLDLPEPETPVTQVKAPSGTLTSTPFRLWARAPLHLEEEAVAAPPLRGHGDAQLAPQVLGGQAARVLEELREGALEDHAAPLLPRPGPEVDHVIGGAHQGGIVLHHQHGVALVAQRAQDADEALGIPGMQPDRGLVEHVEGAPQSRAHGGGEGDALGLAPRQRARRGGRG